MAQEEPTEPAHHYGTAFDAGDTALYNVFRSTPLQIADQGWTARPQPRRVTRAFQCADFR
jgi:hypothetical protein